MGGAKGDGLQAVPLSRGADAASEGWKLTAIAGVVLVEILIVAGLYQIAADLDCPAVSPVGLCIFLRDLVGRALAIGALLAVFAPARRRSFAFLLVLRPDRRVWPWSVLHFAGVALVLAPLLGDTTDFAAIFTISLGFWLVGTVLAGTGLLLWLAPVAAWVRALRHEGRLIAALVAAGFFLPDFVALVDRLWLWSPLTGATFDLVALTLSPFEADLLLDKPNFLMGVGDFVVEVGPACAGYQGMALVCVLLAAYFYVYRSELCFPNAFLLLPLGIAASFVLNVLRISLLIRIGAHVDPDLAVNGFHSHAGWLLFTMLAFALIGAGQTIPFFRAAPTRSAPASLPLRSDPLAGMILPFTVFMASGLAASAFVATPGLVYPLRMTVTGLVLLAFVPLYRRIEWRLDPIAAFAGIVVGAAWLVTAPAASAPDLRLAAELADLPQALFVAWVAARLFGAVIVAPVVEELFFRGYLLLRFDGPGSRRSLALAGSSIAFALLHDRWLEGFLAGLVFGLIALRRGRVGDALLAHSLANVVLGADALWRLDWSAM